MNKDRLEAFSDGVMAIIITIMVLDLKVPDNPSWHDYLHAWPLFGSYALSFVFVGLYWSSHHHLLHPVTRVNNMTLWVNLLGLFFLSLIPFTAGSMGENAFTKETVTVYAVVLAMVSICYIWLANQLCALHGADSAYTRSFGGHTRSYVTIASNFAAAAVAFFGFPRIAFLMMCVMALVWFVPNQRFDTGQS